MTTLTWARQRELIQEDIDRYFGRTINIAPRAMASLQAGASVDPPQVAYAPRVFDNCIAKSLLASSPAAATFLFKAGVQLERLELGEVSDQPAPLGIGTLDWVFRGIDKMVPGDSTTWTATGRRVNASRYLDENSILMSSLEASLQGTEHNSLGGAIVRAAGHKDPIRIRSSDPEGWRASDRYLRKVLRSVRGLALADASHALLQFVLFQDDTNRVRVRPFGVTELAHLDGRGPLSDHTTYVYRGGVLQPITTIDPGALPGVLDHFESLLNSRRVREHDFQRFFEANRWLLTGLDFANAHPQPILHVDNGTTLIPDFFLENLSSGWDALLDIKRPFDEMVVRRRNRVYFAQHVQNAIAQLRYYRDWFEHASNRRAFAAYYGVSTFRPRMVIVVGRKHHFRDDVERIRLSEALPSALELWTYDDLALRARRYLELTALEPARSPGTRK